MSRQNSVVGLNLKASIRKFGAFQFDTSIPKFSFAINL